MPPGTNNNRIIIEVPMKWFLAFVIRMTDLPLPEETA
jgi:hypothetical protein